MIITQSHIKRDQSIATAYQEDGGLFPTKKSENWLLSNYWFNTAKII